VTQLRDHTRVRFQFHMGVGVACVHVRSGTIAGLVGSRTMGLVANAG